ncbi:hypothetical protein [Photobacterium angustum]|uniref:Gp5/Type VI secretion system Vgr protein OB-fold domain-containing protein n=1 Tax=Photobacterium angustum TaxID=661 RepID=A0A855SFU4_PHOAN|nr:hypothetical protein [Photobacterium angustum]KJF83552.1 hypothetical protein UB36_03180 [Photobacterium damselae subsp. damselae]KJG42583.1 hypothetical protein UA35_00880 [Photobacterium angustum]KJG47860.1 hypothetical protein UA31_03180 [Photobacterium angustum]KJG49884.1 hypothetical protein UA30_05015 [Photobacterium angustum]KJG54025.1 hypothetical protein UA34_07140 [Photobacterium angustum]
MEDTIKRIIQRLFPELTGKWHLPRWGKVVALPELPTEGDLSDRFYPHYAADIVLLNEKGVEYEDKSPLLAVPLPVPGVGEYAGRYEPPAIGSIVEIGFIFGQADKPFIRCVLPLGFKLPAIKEGESRYQQRQGVYQHVDQDGNFDDVTDKVASLQCKVRKVIASESQSHQSPKTWIGSDGENVLKLLSELMQVVTELSGTIASHTHTSPETSAPTSKPIQSGTIKGHGAASTGLKKRLDPITK